MGTLASALGEMELVQSFQQTDIIHPAQGQGHSGEENGGRAGDCAGMEARTVAGTRGDSSQVSETSATSGCTLKWGEMA